MMTNHSIRVQLNSEPLRLIRAATHEVGFKKNELVIFFKGGVRVSPSVGRHDFQSDVIISPSIHNWY